MPHKTIRMLTHHMLARIIGTVFVVLLGGGFLNIAPESVSVSTVAAQTRNAECFNRNDRRCSNYSGRSRPSYNRSYSRAPSYRAPVRYYAPAPRYVAPAPRYVRPAPSYRPVYHFRRR